MAHVPLWRRYARLFGPDPKADVHDELQFHLEAKVEDLVNEGWQRDAARREAERQFGDLRVVQHEGERMSEEMNRRKQRKDYRGEWVQDLRYTFRTLRKEPAFATITVLILALGIAANTVVFSVVDTVLLRPLPFPQADRLTWLSAGRTLNLGLLKTAGLSGVTYTVSAYEEFQRHNQSFASVTSYNPFFGNSEYTMTGHGEPQPVAGVMVAENFFQTLGVEPALGRLFVKEECEKGGRHAVLLSDAFWRNQFNGDPAIVGQAITLSKQRATVVGVLPANFDFGSVFSPGLKIDVYVPAPMYELRTWGNTLAVVARLKPGVSVEQAQAEADILFPQLKAAHADWFYDYGSTITGLKEFVSGKLRRSLMVLWWAVGLILLMVCVNLSNLLLARAASRGKEFAMRTALGAGRGRLFRQLMTESLVLACAGAVLGLALAYAGTTLLAHQSSITVPLLSSVRVDGAALGWTVMITLAATLLFGFVPGMKLSAGNLQDALKDSGQGMSSGRKHERLKTAMVISEVTLACVLLIGAGLLMRSFLHLLDVDLGFQPSRAAVIKIDYDGGDKGERRGVVLQQILGKIRAIPGIESAGVTDMLPLGRNRSWGMAAQGKTYAKSANQSALVRIVTPGYLEAMGMHLLEGRDFTWHDGAKSEQVMIINQAAARYFWQGEDPLGRLAQMNGNTRVIGVIADVRETTLETAADPEMYLPVTQADPEGAELVMRTRLPADAIASSVMTSLRSLNPHQPASEIRPLQQLVDRAVSPRRFFVMLIGGFAVFGLVLASLGIYGVMSYSVTGQTQEIGIRMALGATAPQVQMGVLKRALRLAVGGAVLGMAGSLVAARWIATMLFGTQATDPVTFISIVLLLFVVSLVAAYVPARRASRIQPMVALRSN